MNLEMPQKPLDQVESEKDINSLISEVDKGIETNNPQKIKESWNRIKEMLKQLGDHVAKPLK